MTNKRSTTFKDDDDVPANSPDKNYFTVYDKTLEECKQLCESGTWEGCIGFSRENKYSATAEQACYWVNSLADFIRHTDGTNGYSFFFL